MQKNTNVLINEMYHQLFLIHFKIVFAKNSYFQQLCLSLSHEKIFLSIKYIFG